MNEPRSELANKRPISAGDVIDAKTIITSLRKHIGTGPVTRYFNELIVLEEDEKNLTIGLPSKFLLECIDRSLAGRVHTALAREHGVESVRFEVYQRCAPQRSASARSPRAGDAPGSPGKSEEGEGQEISGRSPRQPEKPGSRGLNLKLTLERFVVGSSNRIAYNAGLEVLRTPGVAYNPLFIHGGSGLGKTHLLQGIVRQFFAQGERGIRYLSCESFVNQFLRAMRYRELEGFRNRLRNLRVLAIDDIQMIASKKSCQQELLETVDAIATSGGQVLLASDESPRSLGRLHQQLRSRFVAGLVSRIEPPDLPTRIAILRAEAFRSRTPVSDDVLIFMAESFTRNVRELIGAFVRVCAQSVLVGEKIDVVRVREILEPTIWEQQKRVDLDQIVNLVAVHHGIPPEEIRSRTRSRSVSFARHVVIYLTRALTEMSLEEIGRALGGRTHATTWAGYRKILDLLKIDEGLRHDLERLSSRLKG